MTASKLRNCAVAVFVALVAGACGSGGDDGVATGAKGAYVAQVDPVCADLQGKIGNLGEDPKAQAIAIEAAVETMSAVSKPAEDSEVADLFLAGMQNLYLSLQAIDQARLVNDQDRITRATADVAVASKTAVSAAKKYGMVKCAKAL